MKGFFAIVLLNVILLASCTKTVSEIPSYLKVDSVSIASLPNIASTHGIYGLHVIIENDNRGSWQIPFLMPVLSFGSRTAIIAPIVKRNNLSTLLEAYPLYDPISVPVNFVSGITKDTSFQFQYSSSVTTTLNESMELTNNFNPSTSTLVSDQARTGSKSLFMALDSSNVSLNLVSLYNRPINLSQTKQVYLEFDYYMPEGAFSPSLSYEDANGTRKNIFFDNFLLPNSRWTHVYWMLTEAVRVNGQPSYTLGLNLTIREGKSNAKIYIDNLRIMEK
jgi:hypothetical protein